MKSALRFCLMSLCTLLPLGAAAQNFGDELDGVNWNKTLRIRGVIGRFDPFNETSLYRVGSGGPNAGITARAELVQFETIAAGFWGVLRDSLQEAIRTGELNVYTLGFPKTGGRIEIRTKRTKVTYNDLLDSLSTAFVNFVSPSDRSIQIYDPTEDANQGMSRFVERQKAQARGKRILTDLRLFTVYELELQIAVDETGFKIKPTALIFGTAHWPEDIYFNPKNLLQQMYTGYDSSDPRNPKNLGFYVDLTEPRSIQWLVENGMQYSGERNIIPFYDLMTLFHYPYKIYSESNYVLAIESFASKGKYNLEELEKMLLDRYNDMIYTYLYGQAPEWWDQGKRGAFTNGMFEVDTLRAKQAQAAPETQGAQPAGRPNQPAAQPAEEQRPSGRGGAGRRGGGGAAADQGGQAPAQQNAAPARKNTTGNTPAQQPAAKPAPAQQDAAPAGGGGGGRRRRRN